MARESVTTRLGPGGHFASPARPSAAFCRVMATPEGRRDCESGLPIT